MPPQEPATPESPQTPPTGPAAPPPPPVVPSPAPQSAAPQEQSIQATANQLNNQIQTSLEKKGIPKIVKIILAVFFGMFFVFGLIIIGIVLLVNNGSKDAVVAGDQFVSNLQSNNPTAAYDQASTEFKAASTESDVATTFSSISASLQGTKSVSGKYLSKSGGSSEQAAIVYTVHTSNGDKYIRVILQKDDNTWKVLNFRSSDSPLEAKIE